MTVMGRGLAFQLHDDKCRARFEELFKDKAKVINARIRMQEFKRREGERRRVKECGRGGVECKDDGGKRGVEYSGSGGSESKACVSGGIDACPPKEDIMRQENQTESRVAQEIGRRLDREERESRGDSSGARFESKTSVAKEEVSVEKREGGKLEAEVRKKVRVQEDKDAREIAKAFRAYERERQQEDREAKRSRLAQLVSGLLTTCPWWK